ncbi:AraC-like DNA-binding protein [Amycolatopsis bartoniae]|uniref:Transcriptional regulator n=1 Tax=Amycolatopsis bartoniae TaxID=941986 RepID=A0A8H9IN15_9PSEU|nr:AraC family transcriptional regulator [Amycolatopsis bartoniae]MBB2939883.1 AraC-like DNA-binding protein [Amycolatopsis bartoniae]GHF35896.1 transcriptional regulator [Amycolatopsis bartoniae]
MHSTEMTALRSTLLPEGSDGPATPRGFRELCHAAPFEVFRERLNEVFYPARVTPAGRAEGELPLSRLSATRLEHLTLGLVRFGVETTVDPGALGAYHVNVPLSGVVATQCGRQEMTAVPGRAAVFTPREHTFLPRWGEDAMQLCVKISRRVLEEELEAVLGHPVGSWVRFALDLDVTRGAGKSWLDTLGLLLSELGNPDSLVHRSDRHREYLERMVIGGLVLAQHHDYASELRDPAPPARPRTIKRVVEAVDSAPEKPWSLGELAQLAGVSGRRLQQGFREHLGMSPSAYVRAVRLDRAHGELVTGAASVADVAHRWGFVNLGRFAQAYRERFGEAPSATLRRAR